MVTSAKLMDDMITLEANLGKFSSIAKVVLDKIHQK